MPAALRLKLDVSDVFTLDTLRGPGSSSTEQIPSTSPGLYSPFPPSFDAYRTEQSDTVAALDALKESDLDSELGEIFGLHVVIVGGDMGAFATALALAKSEKIRVTLVNVGVGSLNILGTNDASRGSLLNAWTLAYLDELGNWEGSARRNLQQDALFNLESRSNRWKGKGSMNDSFSIGERVREEGYCLNAFQFQRYSDGEQLVNQEYSIATGEDVSMIGIDADTLLTILRDACLSHPRIVVRPRGIVGAVLSEFSVPHSTRQNAFQQEKNASNGESTIYKSNGTAAHTRPQTPKRDRERRRRARESFIQLDDDEQDDAPTFSFASQNASMPFSATDVSLSDLMRGFPSQPQGLDLFSTEDLPSDVSAAKLNNGFEPDVGPYKPVVVLTSGERLEADAVVGTEGPESKVLDAIHSARGEIQGAEVVREDGIFRATVPISRLLEDPELRARAGILTAWLGPGRILNAYPINQNLLQISLFVEGDRVRDHIVDDDDDDIALARRMKNEVADWCPIVRKLVALVDSASFEPLFDLNPLETCVSDSGRVAVLGSAVHPLLPFASHQALNVTVSDALTLGAMAEKYLSHPSYRDLNANLSFPLLVPRLLNAFASIRRPHYLRTQLTLRDGRDLLLLPDGKGQRMRDKAFKESGLLNEEEKRSEWLFDPFQVVERWWEIEARTIISEG